MARHLGRDAGRSSALAVAALALAPTISDDLGRRETAAISTPATIERSHPSAAVTTASETPRVWAARRTA